MRHGLVDHDGTMRLANGFQDGVIVKWSQDPQIDYFAVDSASDNSLAASSAFQREPP